MLHSWRASLANYAGQIGNRTAAAAAAAAEWAAAAISSSSSAAADAAPQAVQGGLQPEKQHVCPCRVQGSAAAARPTRLVRPARA